MRGVSKAWHPCVQSIGLPCKPHILIGAFLPDTRAHSTTSQNHHLILFSEPSRKCSTHSSLFWVVWRTYSFSEALGLGFGAEEFAIVLSLGEEGRELWQILLRALFILLLCGLQDGLLVDVGGRGSLRVPWVWELPVRVLSVFIVIVIIGFVFGAIGSVIGFWGSAWRCTSPAVASWASLELTG